MEKFDFGKDVAENTAFDFGKEAAGVDISNLKIGANWGMKKGLFGNKSAVDLDLFGFIMNTRTGAEVERVQFGSLTSRRMKHSGDDRRGDSAPERDDNEILSIDPNSLKDDEVLLIGIISYSGDKVSSVPFAALRVYTGAANRPAKELAHTDLATTKCGGLFGVVKKENGSPVFYSIRQEIDKLGSSAVSAIIRKAKEFAQS